MQPLSLLAGPSAVPRYYLPRLQDCLPLSSPASPDPVLLYVVQAEPWWFSAACIFARTDGLDQHAVSYSAAMS